MNKAQENSVRHLENLYTVVVGLGLSISIINLIDATKSPFPVKLKLIPFFLAYIVTLIPFYHGALRHLDFTYVEQDGRHIRSGALIADFGLLFIESCLILALAVLLPMPTYFTWGLIALLSFDAIWGFFAHVGFSPDVKPKAESRWALINIITAVALVLYIIVLEKMSSSGRMLPWEGILAISIVRTIIDYYACWETYFPSGRSQ